MRKSTSNSDPFAAFPSQRKQGISRKPPVAYAPPTPSAYTLQQVLSWYYHTRQDRWWKTQMPITTVAFDAVIGTGTELRHALNPKKSTKPDETLTRISFLISDIEKRKLVFPLVTQSGKKGVTTPKFLWLEPEPDRVIEKLSSKSCWSIWSRCRSCGGNKFLPIAIDLKPHVACYSCLPPDQYPVIGAYTVHGSLIHEALKKYY